MPATTIAGTVLRAAYAAKQGLTPLLWTVPRSVPLYVESDTATQIGTCVLSRDVNGTVTATCTLLPQHERWTAIRPYLQARTSGTGSTTVTGCGVWVSTPDAGQAAWTKV